MKNAKTSATFSATISLFGNVWFGYTGSFIYVEQNINTFVAIIAYMHPVKMHISAKALVFDTTKIKI